MKRILLATTALMLSVGGVFGATQSFSNSVTYNFVFNNQPLAIPAFDPSLGTLIGVSYDWEFNSEIDWQIFQETGSTQTYDFDASATLTLKAPYPEYLALASEGLVGSDTQSIADVNPGIFGLDGSGTIALGSKSGSGNDDANLAHYIGVGNLDFLVSGTGKLLVDGPAPFNTGINGRGSFDLTVEYTYVPVPEVNAAYFAAFLCLPVLGLKWYRRHQSRATA